MDTTRHTGRIALVTGAGYGIGRATALRLAREGAVVTGCDISDEGIRLAQAEFAAAGVKVALHKADITVQGDVERAVAEVLAAHGRIDILANIAGIMDWFLPAHELDDETWRRVMGVNAEGPMRLMRAVLPGMLERKAGAIVNIASFGGLHGGAAGFAYTASKHAVVGMTRSVAWTYRDEGIRCNAICPGGVETNIGVTAVPRSMWGLEKLARIHAAAGAPAKPDQIAALVSWLASEEASNVNGAIVADDGGWGAG